MTTTKNDEIIKAAITNQVTAQYMLAEFGETLGVYSDGSVSIGQSVGDEIAKDERPISCVYCPGFSNQDKTVYTDGLEYNEDNEKYVDDDGSSMTIEECVSNACGIDYSFKDELIEKLTINLG